jgi:sulfonate transport system substrate-binding protein
MKRIFTLFAALVGLIAYSALPAHAAENKPKVVRIGSAYTAGYGKPYSGGIIGLVHAQGLLEEEFKNDGIKIEWYFFKGAGPATNESLANTAIDFAYIGDLPAIVGRAGGLKTKFIAGGSKWTNVYVAVPPDSQIKTIQELKGKRVGLFKGTNAHLTFARILAANGLKESDLRIYNLGIADLDAALKTKNIDASVAWTNNIILRTQGNAKIIYSTKTSPRDWRNTGGFYVTEKFANTYPDITKRIVRRYVEAAKWGSDEVNRKAFLDFTAKAGVPRAISVEEIEGRTLKDINDPLFDAEYVNHYVGGVAFAKEKGLIRNTFDVNTWIDRSYLDAALRELKLEGYWK